MIWAEVKEGLEYQYEMEPDDHVIVSGSDDRFQVCRKNKHGQWVLLSNVPLQTALRAGEEYIEGF